MQSPRDFSMYGAVDLGARQAAAQRRQQAAQAAASSGAPAGGPASAFVFDVTEETFNDDVVLRSRTTPVVVDMWADWCGPCKQLSPVLEKLANEAGGAWVLAKLDVDANQRLAQAMFQMFQAQSIPLVVAFLGGQVLDGFLGALPEAQLKQWLAQVLAAAEQVGLRPAGEAAEEAQPQADGAEGEDDPWGDLPPSLGAARDAMESGDLDAAARALEKALADAPADPLAKSWLAQVNLMRRVSSYDPAEASREAAAHPEDVGAQLRVADFEMAGGDAESAFDRILAVIKRTSGDERNTARLHLLDLFEVLPPDDDRIRKARSQLQLLLF